MPAWEAGIAAREGGQPKPLLRHRDENFSAALAIFWLTLAKLMLLYGHEEQHCKRRAEHVC